jgi:hypothetical protein
MEASCAIHGGNEAVSVCDRCGNNICRLCWTWWHGREMCVECVERRLQERDERAQGLENEHRRAAFLSLLFGLIAWGLLVTVALSLVAIGLSAAGDRGAALIPVLFLGVLAAPAFAAMGLGMGAGAIRTRGDYMVIATIGTCLCALLVSIVLTFVVAAFIAMRGAAGP